MALLHWQCNMYVINASVRGVWSVALQICTWMHIVNLIGGGNQSVTLSINGVGEYKLKIRILHNHITYFIFPSFLHHFVGNGFLSWQPWCILNLYWIWFGQLAADYGMDLLLVGRNQDKLRTVAALISEYQMLTLIIII